MTNNLSEITFAIKVSSLPDAYVIELVEPYDTINVFELKRIVNDKAVKKYLESIHEHLVSRYFSLINVVKKEGLSLYEYTSIKSVFEYNDQE